jgi:hypothetical protein
LREIAPRDNFLAIANPSGLRGYDPQLELNILRAAHGLHTSDVIEADKPQVDRAMVNFVKAQAFDPADFVVQTAFVALIRKRHG